MIEINFIESFEDDINLDPYQIAEIIYPKMSGLFLIIGTSPSGHARYAYLLRHKPPTTRRIVNPVVVVKAGRGQCPLRGMMRLFEKEICSCMHWQFDHDEVIWEYY
ncbi:hypothetical protein POX_g09218 [Penicillium oxalicum]|uniref:hypothetical protein n=1 Tax=Penicillium oxalicum TaxID=69781 RepID=UPI0020B698C1|nr:hypothetical protein POX_g09218 [Penicillium oxalicum]KAI2786823.1 hypothetical protein POX_g09218 [Penicillium oxalicum]